MAVKIALIQMDTSLGDKKSNLEKGLKCIEEAKRKGANIVCFPELFTTGYELTLQQYLALAETIPGETTEKIERRRINDHRRHHRKR
jgi:Predicted amidohydrolase